MKCRLGYAGSPGPFLIKKISPVKLRYDSFKHYILGLLIKSAASFFMGEGPGADLIKLFILE